MSPVLLTKTTCLALTTGLASSFVLLATGPALALDARGLALGGSAIASAQGAQGAFDNPASLMQLQRTGKRWHLHSGVAADLRDDGAVIQAAMDADDDNLLNDLDTELETLNGAPISCIDANSPTFPDANTPCLSGTAGLSDVSRRAVNLLDKLDEQDVEGQAGASFGLAMTGEQVPVAITVRTSATGTGMVNVTDQDRTYVDGFIDIMAIDAADASADGVLTYGEILDNPAIDISTTKIDTPDGPVDVPTGTLRVDRPEEVLDSSGQGATLLRAQLGIGLAMPFIVKGMPVDLGVTPKFSRLYASNVDEKLADSFNDAISESALDRLEASEVVESSFTLDAGASMAIPGKPLRAAVVLRNAIPETISTANGYTFETTPQLTLGGAWQVNERLIATADLALNEAERDNFTTQPIALGLEFTQGRFSARGGISHDTARDADATALSAGLGIGFFQIGARLADFDNSLQASAQVAFSF